MTTRISDKEALLAVGAYALMRSGRDAYAKNQEKEGATLKTYLAQNPGPLFDEGSGYEAKLTTTRKAPTYDCASMSAGLLEWCAKHGLLEVDDKAYKAIRDRFIEGLEVAKYAIPGAETVRLDVSRKE